MTDENLNTNDDEIGQEPNWDSVVSLKFWMEVAKHNQETFGDMAKNDEYGDFAPMAEEAKNTAQSMKERIAELEAEQANKDKHEEETK